MMPFPQNVPAANSSTTGKKRPFEQSSSSGSSPRPSNVPTFGADQNIPFSFRPAQVLPEFPQSPKAQAWSPPPNFSPEKAFPIPAADQGNAPISTVALVGKARRPVIGRILGQWQKELIPTRNHSAGDLGDGNEVGATPTAQTTSNQFILNLPRPAYHVDLPFILKGHLQFCFGFCLRALFVYIFTRLIVAIQRDVRERMSENSLGITQEIALCAFQYENNLCETNLVPAMVRQCSNWETCMNRNPTVVGRMKVGAELIGEALNSLVEPISWKTMIFVLITLSCCALFRAILARRQYHSGADSQARYDPPQDYRSFLPPFLPTGRHPLQQTSDRNTVNPVRRRRLGGWTAMNGAR